MQSTPAKVRRRNWLYAALWAMGGCLIVVFVGLFALTSPAFASIVGNLNTPVPTHEKHWASVYIAKPTMTPIGNEPILVSQVVDAPTLIASSTPTLLPMDPATVTATEAPTLTPQATETPGVLSMEIVPDTPTSEYVPPINEQTPYPSRGNGERWIDVDLSEQRVYAYEGDAIVNSFIVSTGLPETPTVKGKYRIWIKVRVQDMSGAGYYLRDVPYVMFFYEDYALHGTYWHNNFGQPMSRGCVNLRIDDAAWLFNWASVGTVVNVHE